MDCKQLIYEIMNGDIIIKNEFAQNTECSKLYEEIFNAKTRICDRLGIKSGEDRDINIIIDNMSEIGKILSMTMFEYGIDFGIINKGDVNI